MKIFRLTVLFLCIASAVFSQETTDRTLHHLSNKACKQKDYETIYRHFDTLNRLNSEKHPGLFQCLVEAAFYTGHRKAFQQLIDTAGKNAFPDSVAQSLAKLKGRLTTFKTMLSTADSLIRKGNYTIARLHLVAFKDSFSQFPLPYYRLAKVNIETEDYLLAKDNIQKCLAIDSSYAKAWALKSKFYFRQSKYDKAKAILDTAIHYEPSNARFYFQKGIFCYKLKDTNCMLKQFSKAVELNDTVADYHYYLGYTNLLKGNSEKGMKNFNRVLSLDKDHRLAMEKMGITAFMMGKYIRAIRLGRQLIEQNPGNSTYHFLVGASYHEKGSSEFEEKMAIKHLSKAIQLRPDSGIYYTLRGKAYKTLDQYKKALRDFKKSLELIPYNFGNYKGLHHIYSYYGSPFTNEQKAKAIARRCYDTFKRQYQLAYQDDESYFKAAKCLKMLQEFREENYTDEIISNFEKALSYAPGNREYLKELIVYLFDNSKYEQLIKYAKKGVAQHPSEVKYWFYLAKALRQSEAHKEALHYLNQGLNVHPRSTLLLRQRANVHEKLGKQENAKEDRQKIKTLHRK